MPPGSSFPPAICVVGFHHARGPEIETWYGVEDGTDPAVENDWSFLPFMALSDGAHTFSEDFSYFTLRKKETNDSTATSLFGMSCTRQIDAKELLEKPDDVTRSTVQKSVVIVAQSPHFFPGWREKLSLVTKAWFMQRDFRDTQILKDFQESLKPDPDPDPDDEREQFLGKLWHPMLFFGSKCERLCMMQFGLISLIPGLIRHLEDCADPDLDSYEKSMVQPSSLRTSDRSSLLSYMGLPLQIFGKGSHFGPYTPLQQLDMLADFGTKSYIVGSTNSLLLQQKDRYSDVIINLDDATISITSASLRSALNLSHADRRWIDFLHQKVAATWDTENPPRPTNHGYVGSEEFIRLQFEEYLLALLAATKYHLYLYTVPHHKRDLSAFTDIEGDPSLDFGEAWLDSWKGTSNYKLWAHFTDSHLFDIVDPRHPTAGALSIEDINRRVTAQIEDLHLEESFAISREAINKHLATGKRQVSTAFNNLWAEIETFRSAQRAKAAEQRLNANAPYSPSGNANLPSTPSTAPLSKSHSASALPSPSRFEIGSSSSVSSSNQPTPNSSTALFDTSNLRARAPDLSQAQAAMGAAGQKASAYFSSWGAWASERRRGWANSRGSEGTSEEKTKGLKQLRLGSGLARGTVVEVDPRSAPAGVATFGEKGKERQSLDERLKRVSGGTEKAAEKKVGQEDWKGKEVENEKKEEPRSPTKRGVEKGRGKRREEKGSDGIGRLDA